MIILRLLLTLWLIVVGVFADEIDEREELNDHGAEEEVVKVHVVPHSHMDAGWLYSVDYLYKYGASKIFTAIYNSLMADKKRTYTHGDIYFFRRWYME